jgi:hypothetical protein
MRALRNTTHAILTILFSMVALACGTHDEDEQLGQVELTLSAVDGEGNTWRLPAGTSLYVSKGNFQDSLPLDGSTAVATFSLPVGMFEWELTNPNVFGGEWPLEREDALNNVDTVMATLGNPQPHTFLVLPSSTTSLSLQFNAALGGKISFAKGTVDVDLAVTTTEESGGDIAWGAPVQATTVTNGSTAPTSLASSLPAVGQLFDVTLGVHVAGPWEMTSSDKVCAPVTADFAGSSSWGVQDLIAEAAGAAGDDGTICLTTSGAVALFVTRAGAPMTSTFSGLGSSVMDFETLFVATLPVPAFDGDDLDLSLLSGTHTLSSTVFLGVWEIANGGGQWYSAVANGQATFNFSPTPVSP